MSEGLDTTVTTDPPAAPVTTDPDSAGVSGSPLGGSPLGEATASAPEGTDTVTGTEGADTVSGSDTATTPLSADSYTFTLPDGVTVDPAAMSTLKETFAQSNIPPEAGQALVDLHIAELTRVTEAITAANTAAWNETVDGWKAALAADPDYGPDKMPAVQTVLGRMLDEYGDADTRKAFELTGAGWNPALVKFVHKMGVALSEGNLHPSTGPVRDFKNLSPAEILFPDKVS